MKEIRVFGIEVIISLLVFQGILTNYYSLAQYIDEILALLIFFVGLLMWLKNGKLEIGISNYIWIVALLNFNLITWVSSGLSDYRNISISLMSFFLGNKFFIVMIGVILVCQYSSYYNCFLKSLKCIRPLIVILLLWKIFALKVEFMIDIEGIDLCAKIVFLVSLLFLDWKGKWDNLYIILACGMLCSTGKGKAHGAILIIAAIIVWILVLQKKIRIKEIIIGLISLIVLVWPKIYRYYVKGFNAGHPRAMLIKYGICLAKNLFPFGTGWGTFGSYYAAKYYSPVYYELGWSSLQNVGMAYRNFLNDNYWGMILGETGFIGCVMIILFFTFVFFIFQKQYVFNKKNMLQAFWLLHT